MTDNEIIKALECCSVHPMKCKKCPYKGNECCTNAHRKDALDLINRQKEEIEELTTLCDMQDKFMLEQKEEIERLTTLAELGNMRANDYRAMRDKAKNARAEAIKEFAERLKELMKYETVIYDCHIDNLVKDMAEDQI